MDLRTGSHIPDNDVVFHLSIHPSSDVIIRNHKENGQWFDEEREGGCPIQFGDQFKMLIYVENDNIKVSHSYFNILNSIKHSNFQFKVSINNFPFCEFTPRLPLSSAKFLSIGGGVIIHNVSIKNEN